MEIIYVSFMQASFPPLPPLFTFLIGFFDYFVCINNNEDLTRCIERSGGLTVKLLLTNEITIIPKGNPDQSEMQKALMGIQERDGDRRE